VGAITTGNANQLIPAYLCVYVLCIHTVMKYESMNRNTETLKTEILKERVHITEKGGLRG
jgi:hypothetical protein